MKAAGSLGDTDGEVARQVVRGRDGGIGSIALGDREFACLLSTRSFNSGWDGCCCWRCDLRALGSEAAPLSRRRAVVSAGRGVGVRERAQSSELRGEVNLIKVVSLFDKDSLRLFHTMTLL